MSAADFRSAADAAFARIEELRAERRRAEPVPPPPPFSAETRRPEADPLPSLRFTAEGERVEVLEEDGGVVLGTLRGEERIWDAGELRRISALPFRAAFRALRAAEDRAAAREFYPRSGGIRLGFRTDAPFYALRGTAGERRRVVIFRGRLCVPFVKRRGTRTYFAPVSEEEAEAVLRGRKSVFYYSGTSRFVVK